jgi:hypothetical protein
VQWVLSGKPTNLVPTRINLVHSLGFEVLLKLMLLVIWVLGMQGKIRLDNGMAILVKSI